MARETHAPDAYGEVVWFGRRGAGAKLALRSAGDGGKRAVLREEHEVSRKSHCAGKAGMLRLYLFARVQFCLRKSHARPRVQRAPRSSLRPLFFERVKSKQTSGDWRREKAGLRPFQRVDSCNVIL